MEANAACCQLAQIKNHCKRHRRQRSRICSPTSLPAFCFKKWKVTRLLSCVIVELLMRFPSKSSTLKHRVQSAQILGYEKSVRHMQALPHSYAKRAKEFMMYAASSQWHHNVHKSCLSWCWLVCWLLLFYRSRFCMSSQKTHKYTHTHTTHTSLTFVFVRTFHRPLKLRGAVKIHQ